MLFEDKKKKTGFLQKKLIFPTEKIFERLIGGGRYARRPGLE